MMRNAEMGAGVPSFRLAVPARVKRADPVGALLDNRKVDGVHDSRASGGPDWAA